MTDANRNNYLISMTLNTSPLAREAHDKNYKVLFTYATADDKHSVMANTNGEVPAFLMIPRDQHFKDLKLIYNPKKPDGIVIPSLYHELGHVNQMANAKQHNIPVMDYQLSYDNHMALCLIWEAQAFANQVEGPIMGLLNDLSHNKMDNIDFYKEQFKSWAKVAYGFQNLQTQFVQGLLGNKQPVQNTIDSIAFGYYNNLSLLDAEEYKGRQAQGRKNLIKSFFKLDGLRNNEILDQYVQKSSQEYNADYYEKLSDMKLYGYDMLKTSKKRSPDKKSYLKDIFKTTNFGNEQYLSNEDWYDALQATDTAELTNRALFFSRYKNAAAEDRKRSFVI